MGIETLLLEIALRSLSLSAPPKRQQLEEGVLVCRPSAKVDCGAVCLSWSLMSSGVKYRGVYLRDGYANRKLEGGPGSYTISNREG
jgi:hypothetical protein